MQTIRQIGVLSAGKIYGIIAGVFGLIFGAFISLFSILGASMSAMSGTDGGPFMMLFGAGAIILLPIFYGVIGFLGGMLQAWIYNFATRFVGGIEVEIS